MLADKHQSQIMCGLLEAELNRLEKEVQAKENTSFEVNEFTLCSDCEKPFNIPRRFVRFPNGDIVHLSCYDRLAQEAGQKQ